MKTKSLHLQILSPEEQIFSGEISKITLPGTAGRFTVLPGHAPLISSLERGLVRFLPTSPSASAGEISIAVSRGFAEIKENNVTVCIEKEQEA